MAIPVKICGLTREEDIEAAIEGGAAFLGFNFYPPSKRFISPARWRELHGFLAGRLPTVGVFVDPEDAWLDEVMSAAPLDVIQLHGGEVPSRVAEIAQHYRCRTIKALAVAEASDVERHRAYAHVADLIMFDAKPPRAPDAIPGGNGLAFDWRLLSGKDIELPWLLAGGLGIANFRRAVEITGAPMVDLASSIEDAPGIKNKDQLRCLLSLAAELETA